MMNSTRNETPKRYAGGMAFLLLILMPIAFTGCMRLPDKDDATIVDEKSEAKTNESAAEADSTKTKSNAPAKTITLSLSGTEGKEGTGKIGESKFKIQNGVGKFPAELLGAETETVDVLIKLTDSGEEFTQTIKTDKDELALGLIAVSKPNGATATKAILSGNNPKTPKTPDSPERSPKELLASVKEKLHGNQASEAEKTLTTVIAKDDSFLDAYRDRAIARTTQGKYGEAIADFEKAIQLDAKDYKTREQYAKTLSMMGDYQGSRKQCDVALQHRPDSPVARYLSSQIHYQLADYAAARADADHLTKVSKLPEHVGYSLNLIGVIEMQRDNTHVAYESFQKAIAAYPDGVDAYRNLSKCARTISKGSTTPSESMHLNSALSYCTSLIQKHPEYEQPMLAEMAMTKAQMGHTKEAVQHYTKLIDTYKPRKTWYLNRAELHRQLGNERAANQDQAHASQLREIH